MPMSPYSGLWVVRSKQTQDVFKAQIKSDNNLNKTCFHMILELKLFSPEKKIMKK